MILNEKDLKRFWSRVNKNGPIPDYRPDLGPCWIWTAEISDQGYPRFRNSWSIKNTSYRAHRISYELCKGEIPEGLTLDHLCRVRHCVNPDHLEVVTNKTNVLRGVGLTAINARKTHCVRGHEFSPENTRVEIKGNGRVCLKCKRIRYLKSVELRKKS